MGDGWCEGLNWIQLAQNRDHWRAFVNTIVSIRIPYEAGNGVLSE
jgi:hypothetical protein